MEKIKNAFSSKLMLAIDIMFTVASVCTFDLLIILLTIGLWISYGSAKKELGHAGFSMVSGTTNAIKIIALVLACLMILLGILGITSAFLANEFAPDFVEQIDSDAIKTEIDNFFDEASKYVDKVGISNEDFNKIYDSVFSNYDKILDSFGSIVFILLIVLSSIVLFIGVFYFILALTVLRSIHKFTKNVAISVKNGNGEVCGKGVKASFIFMIILSVLSLDVFSTVLFILLTILVSKYFGKSEDDSYEFVYEED